MRWFTPALFLAAAGYVYWYNGQDNSAILIFPFVDVIFPSAKGDPAEMGRLTVALLMGLSVATGIWNLGWAIRARGREE